MLFLKELMKGKKDVTFLARHRPDDAGKSASKQIFMYTEKSKFIGFTLDTMTKAPFACIKSF